MRVGFGGLGVPARPPRLNIHASPTRDGQRCPGAGLGLATTGAAVPARPTEPAPRGTRGCSQSCCPQGVFCLFLSRGNPVPGGPWEEEGGAAEFTAESSAALKPPNFCTVSCKLALQPSHEVFVGSGREKSATRVPRTIPRGTRASRTGTPREGGTAEPALFVGPGPGLARSLNKGAGGLGGSLHTHVRTRVFPTPGSAGLGAAGSSAPSLTGIALALGSRGCGDFALGQRAKEDGSGIHALADGAAEPKILREGWFVRRGSLRARGKFLRHRLLQSLPS